MKNETIETIFNRTSLRDYDPSPLTKDEEDTILEAAMKAPTAGNQMLYSMIIIRDEAVKEKLSVLCDHQSFIKKAPFVIAFIADQHRWFDYYRLSGVDEYCSENNFEFEGADTGDIVLAFEDTMIAAENSVIAAESMGIGSCSIGDFLENYEEIRELLNLPEETFPLSLVCFGHYKEGHKKVFRKRFDRKYIIFEDSYKQLDNEEYKEMYAEREKEFREGNQYNADNFAQQFFARKLAAPFRHEMNRSVAVAMKEWNKKR